MVDVIKRGNPPAHKVFGVTCRACLSDLSFRADDPAVIRVPDQRDGDYFRLQCPVCTWTVTRKASDNRGMQR